MEDVTRFEMLLPLARRAQLDKLSDATGLTSSALARLAIVRLLERPDGLLPRDESRAA